MRYFLDGVEVSNTSFIHAGVQYPSNWCALSTKADKNAIGIVEVFEIYPGLGPYETYGSFTDTGPIDNVITRTYGKIKESNAAIIAKKTTEIKAIRDFHKHNDGYSVGANKFHSDADSRTQQLGLVIMGASLPAGIQWKTMGGSFVTMTPTLALQIFQSAAASDIAIFSLCETKLAELNVAADPSTYDVNAGWPA